MKILLFTSLIIIHLGSFAQRDSLRAYYQAGIHAYETKNYPLYLYNFEKANQIRPNHPTITYNLASAYALNAKEEASLKIIKQLINMNTGVLEDVKKDGDFETLMQLQAFQDLEKFSEQKTYIISKSRQEEIIEMDFNHIEGIAHNANQKEYFLGAVNTRTLFSYSETGLTEITNYKEIPEIFGILGVAYDSSANSIWFCTSASPQMVDYSDSLRGYSSVIEYNLDQKKVVTKIIKKGGSTFGDLVVSRKSEVFVSDGLGNKVFMLKSGNTELSTFIDISSKAFNLQGLSLSENEEFIFVADYIQGVFKIRMVDMEVTKLILPDNVSPKGIDGLYFYKNSLLAIQNGTTPYRIMQLQLNAKLDQVIRVKTFDQARRELNEPTQGILLDHRLIYIANSPWNNYSDDYKLKSAQELLLLSSHLLED